MPMLEEADPVPPVSVRIGISVPVEVFWAAHAIENGRHYRDLPTLLRAPQVFKARLREIWGPGGPSCFGEALVIADKLGVLFTSSIDEFTAALRQGVGIDPRLPLTSETAEDRRAILERCARLAANAGFRRRYAGLAGEVWSLVAEDWESAGWREAELAADRLRRVAAGPATLDQLLAGHHLHEPWYGQVAAAHAAGRLSIAPAFLGGKFLAWDLENTYLVGVQTAPQDDLSRLRREAQQLASRLKVLADPTRLAILITLARQPASVTELARTFGLAQPTVSAHLKLLREAELADGGRESGRPDYAADRRAISTLLKEVEHQFEDHHGLIRPSAPSRAAPAAPRTRSGRR